MKVKTGKIKLKITSGKATPAPPIGSSLGQRGLNIIEFCNFFNSQTKLIVPSVILPVLLILYSDKSYDVIIKKPTISCFLKKIFNINKFSNENKLNNTLDYLKIKEIILYKFDDFNTKNFNSIYNIVLGVIKSIGLNFLY